MTTLKGIPKFRASQPEAKYRYNRSIAIERIRESLTATVERARTGEKRSPVRMWERRYVGDRS